ncbi:MAG: DUF3189 family protein [Firmicutes bacterium]|nr:DUF3189 family protein [Bacillota bacterium]
MNYLYLGLADLYLPATMAAIHLHTLASDVAPAHQQLLALPFYRAVCKNDEGTLYRVGETEAGDGVYIASVKEHAEIFLRGVDSLLGVYKMPRHAVKVVPCLLENPQVGHLCSLLGHIGLHHFADLVGTRLVHNRFYDLKNASKTVPI